MADSIRGETEWRGLLLALQLSACRRSAASDDVTVRSSTAEEEGEGDEGEDGV